MNLNNINKVHFVGIGGIGISAVAKMMLILGKRVSGSDLNNSEIITDLKKRGAKIHLTHKESNLENDTDFLIYSPAVPKDNPERQLAEKLNIPQLSYPEFLGELSKDKFTIAISGTNGKTTSTALLGLILEKAGFDPMVIVGSEIKNFPDGNFRYGNGKYFIVEGCEWRAHMLNLSPQIIVLTNLEEDHLDYYKDLNDIIFHFQQYVYKLPDEGKLILNIDDENLNKLKTKNNVLSFGIKNQAQVMAKNIELGDGFQKFDLFFNQQFLTHIFLKIPGLFNIYNTLAAASCALGLGIKPEIIKEALEAYQGAWRRFEVKKLEIRNLKLDIISDYAHHPTAITGTIKAAREFYPNRRLLVVFQPHHHNRTRTLFNNFVKSFKNADFIIIPEVYDVAGRELKADENISSYDIVEAIKKSNIDTNKQQTVLYAKNLNETKKLILENIQDNDVILVMGAGDIYTIVDDLNK